MAFTHEQAVENGKKSAEKRRKLVKAGLARWPAAIYVDYDHTPILEAKAHSRWYERNFGKRPST